MECKRCRQDQGQFGILDKVRWSSSVGQSVWLLTTRSQVQALPLASSSYRTFSVGFFLFPIFYVVSFLRFQRGEFKQKFTTQMELHASKNDTLNASQPMPNVVDCVPLVYRHIHPALAHTHGLTPKKQGMFMPNSIIIFNFNCCCFQNICEPFTLDLLSFLDFLWESFQAFLHIVYYHFSVLDR